MGTHAPIVAVIAMQVELDHLLAGSAIERRESNGPWSVWHCSFHGQPVVAVLAGIGMVNAAAATEFAINAFGPRAVVNSGCTGAHIDTLGQGDVVIGTATVYHAAMQILATGEERHVGFSFATPNGEVKTRALAADPALLALARTVANEIELPNWQADLAWDAPEPRRPVRIVEGPVASADVWTQQVTRLDHLHALHGTLCEDMEAAAVNQIAARHELPFLSVKDIINNERHAQTRLIQEAIGFEAEFPIQEAGRRSAMLLAEVLRRS
ncbi:MAG: 5'-methylthioadenosine/S-adenosylhomocysteine nucleosidase [Thermomicrobiales bacterium]|nr:5'-methylthioadenosine/S-adenosylhomocysteine nucleosidase [Thermomicrobiales bacterium]